MKILIGFLVIVICTILGNLFSQKYRLKKNIFVDFEGFNTKLKNEVMFSHDTLWSIFSTIDDGEFKNALKIFLESGQVVKIKCFDVNEQDFFTNYLKNIGNFDGRTQLNFINSIEGRLKEYLSTSINNELKYKNLYLKLGLLVGLIVFILLI